MASQRGPRGSSGPRGSRGPRGYGNGGQEFGELKATCGAISKTLEEFRRESSEMFAKIEGALGEDQKRLGSLEKSRTYMAGVIAAVLVIGTIVGWLIQTLTHAQH